MPRPARWSCSASPQNVGGATYVELPGAPHMPTLETPDLVTDALDRFLPCAEPARGHLPR